MNFAGQEREAAVDRRAILLTFPFFYLAFALIFIVFFLSLQAAVCLVAAALGFRTAAGEGLAFGQLSAGRSVFNGRILILYQEILISYSGILISCQEILIYH